MKHTLQEKFEHYIAALQLFGKNDRLLLACSGGVDSVLLCHLLKAAGFGFEIAHCNFKLRALQSEEDEAFVIQLATALAVPCHVQHFDTAAYAAENKLSIQVAARQLRYQWFAELLAAGRQPACLLTAQHADDSIETALMNFFKGTGISGLHGILPKQDNIIRPLLFARKEEIKAYAEELQIRWREDASNASDKYTRNFFRLQVLPLIEKAIPQAGSNALHTIGHLGETEQIYLAAIAQRKKKLLKKVGEEIHIPVEKLKLEKPLKTIAWEIIKDFGFSSAQLPDFLDLLEADTGKFISGASHRIIRNRNWLIIASQAEAGPSVIIIEEADKKVFFANKVLWLKTLPDTAISAKKEVACLDLQKIRFPLLLRRWKQGDYFYPLGMAKKKKIARFLIDQKLSKTEKEHIWVLESNRHIVWIVGHRIDDRFKIADSTSQLLRLEYKSIF